MMVVRIGVFGLATRFRKSLCGDRCILATSACANDAWMNGNV
jgi:hypothetical protein